LVSIKGRKQAVFENKVLKRKSGPKRDDIIAGWRKFKLEELHALCCSPNITRMIK
jgi:hypothetical protein